MDYYSRLGPIDPQVQSLTGETVPALGYLIQWERLLDKANQGTLTTEEAQLMIDGFDQAELYMYEQARELSVDLLREWLATYKFKNWAITETRKIPVDQKMKEDRAEEIALQLNDSDRWHSHGHGISMDVLDRELNLRIKDYGENPNLNSAIRGYHGLLDDYMIRRAMQTVLHTPGQFLPVG